MGGVEEALGLASHGFDVTFATWTCFRDLSWFPSAHVLNPLYRRLAVRLYPELKSIRLRRLILPEIVERLLQPIQLIPESVRFKIHNEFFDWSVARWMEGYDFFHFVNGLGLHTARRARKAGTRVVLSQRAEHPAFATALLEPEYALFGQRYQHPEEAFLDRVYEEQALADYIFTPSSYCAQTFIEQGISRDKLRVVHLSFNSPRFHLVPTKKSIFRVLFVGTIEPRKGVHYLIKAFERARLPQAELWLVGALHPAMRKLIESMPANVRYIAHVPQTRLTEIYSSASVFVLPSLTDSWGFVVLEAMAMGLPVIVTDHTGSKDAVRPGVDGFVVPIRDPDALAEKMTALCLQPELCEAMGRNAAQQARRFAWPHYGRRLAMAYSSFDSASSARTEICNEKNL